MNSNKWVLLIIAIFLFAIGAWPISLILLILYIIPTTEQKQPKKTIEELEKENETLRQELADQAVRRAMDKAEGREKKD